MGCGVPTRVENGTVTANNPEGSPIHKMTAGEQFDTGFSTFITQIRERRFPVVDEERGLVPPPYDTPYTTMIGELFKIKSGQIHRIEAVLLPVPYGMPSGWG